MACFRLMRQKYSSFDLNIVNEKLNQQKIACFRYNTAQKISSLRPAIVYKNFRFTQKDAFAERCCFLTFSFEGKLRKYDISVKRKHTKTNENMIFSALSTKSFFSCSVSIRFSYKTFFMILGNFIIVVSQLKKHQTFHLHTSKAPTPLQSKIKIY